MGHFGEIVVILLITLQQWFLIISPLEQYKFNEFYIKVLITNNYATSILYEKTNHCLNMHLNLLYDILNNYYVGQKSKFNLHVKYKLQL